MPLDKYMEENILIPLKMNNYSYFYDQKDEDKLALPYGRNGKRLPIYLYTENAAGGFICSIKDLANFTLSFINNQDVLSKETVELMIDKKGIPIIGILEKNDNKLIGFGGTTLGYSADLWLNTTTKNGYVSMFNSTNGIYLGADIANQWLMENASIPDPTIMMINIEFYGIRAIAFILGWGLVFLVWRRISKNRSQKEFITLKYYPPYQTPWLPDSFIYLSLIMSLFIVYFIFKILFVYKNTQLKL